MCSQLHSGTASRPHSARVQTCAPPPDQAGPGAGCLAVGTTAAEPGSVEMTQHLGAGGGGAEPQASRQAGHPETHPGTLPAASRGLWARVGSLVVMQALQEAQVRPRCSLATVWGCPVPSPPALLGCGCSLKG